ncbi:class I adenylate-forming enzyme family protein [Pseudohaliea rubra]|uniref:Long-chain-fatty-acid--CoA ligase n=1 Tax=Pseudohaliea rubra DSM 19751 TaxID=1265313 RepID=A0A095VUC6_9GAMM|nr:AMP-binding protein [Pseudohaliea rubra]KGE04975.1 Long-chain-fatty-acid--CoA ligase [Pseudohaliea rubra DSM 19751]
MDSHTIEATSLGDFLVLAANRHPERRALVFPGYDVSYRELLSRAEARARGLVALGAEPGDHVGILAHNRPEVVEQLFACALAGVVAVLLNARYRVDELRYVLGHAELTLLFTGAESEPTDFPALVDAALDGALGAAGNPRSLRPEAAPSLRAVVLFGTGERAGCLTEATVAGLGGAVAPGVIDGRRREVSLREPCLMMYTSGTTSRPKGCLLCHEALVRNALAMRDRLAITADDLQWNPLPLFHMASILPLLAIFGAGGAYLAEAHFEAGPALARLYAHQPTILYPAFPAIMADLLAHPAFDATRLQSVRLINNVAPPETLRANMRALPGALHISAYGMTEASGICCHGAAQEDDETRATTCGRPYPGVQLRVVEPESGTVLPAGQRGEMQVHGFSLFDGYYRDPARTAEALTEDGWFRTGDLCSLTDDGQVVYHGRLKDLLKIGGENVSPLELENWLGTHPAIHLAQVVGAPDHRLGEVAAAFVQLREDATLSAEELVDYCRGQIASFKIPRYVRFVTEWPMSATKIQKHVLAEQLREELAGR